MRILHVETGMNLYGGALQVSYLLRGLSGHPDVHNVLVCPKGSAIAGAASDSVDTLYAVPAGGDLDLAFLVRMVSILRRERPDIVHLHSRRGADVLGGVAARVTGTRCLLTRRVDNPESGLAVGLKYRLYDRVITISEGIREVLASEGVPPGKITCVPSAVDPDRYTGPWDKSTFQEQFDLPSDGPVCGVIAQLIDRKGHRFLIKAIPEILDTVPDATFLFFGKGPEEAELKELCRESGVVGKVRFVGFREDLDDYLGCLDLVIHPALMEGLGVSLLQAAAAGVPIVGTRVGGIPEAVVDGVNGVLVEPGDPVSLARAVVRILTDRDLAAGLGVGGRKLVQDRFSVEAMVKGNLAVYREMTSTRPDSRE
ncbi:MAG: glycosyltransferase family 4 protein [bacterium]|nr:glycosyltransferase family 4 protein [bacterium]